MNLSVNLDLYFLVKKKIGLNLHPNIKVHLNVHMNLHMNLRFHTSLNMNKVVR